jgi:hypothetical protein
MIHAVSRTVDRPRAALAAASVPRSGAGTRELVLASGVLLVAVQLLVRAWALLPSFFVTDDYRLMHDASTQGLSWSSLVAPFDSQFMPWGRLTAWLVWRSGPLDWTLAAVLTLVLSAAASGACLWMLVTLFGARWGVLAPLSLYLFTAMSVPALMWWAASLNQLPLQLVLFAAVGSGVRYLRTRSWWWLAVTTAFLLLGFCAYVKTVLVVLVLAYLAVAYFATGRLDRRVLHAARRYWPAVASVCVLGVGYLAAYLTRVPQAFVHSDRPVAGPLLGTLVGTSFTSAAVGGPARWAAVDLPIGAADPPDVLVHLAWVVIAAVVVHAFLTRTRTLRAWGLLATYLAAVFLLLLGTRAASVGPAVGLQLRYLTDVSGVLALAVGLAHLPLRDAVESSAPREPSLLRVAAGARTAVVATAVVALLGTLSTVRYAELWHHHNASEAYVRTARDSLHRAGVVDLADQVLPDFVMPTFLSPANTTRKLVPLLSAEARFPTVSPRIMVIAPDGSVRQGVVDPEVTSPRGPVAGCGWRVRDASTTRVPLGAPSSGYRPWVRLGYLSSAESAVTVTLGPRTVRTEVRRGIGNVFVRTTDPLHAVEVHVEDPRATVCVDTVQVGDLVPSLRGGP